MRTVITFDTAHLSDPDQRQRIEEAPGFELAPILRALAEECDATSDLPQARDLLLVEGEATIGTVTTDREGAPQEAWQDRLWDAYNLSRAERLGNIRTLDQAHEALEALVGVMRCQNMPERHYEGLLTAIGIVSGTIGERADFLREIAEEGRE